MSKPSIRVFKPFCADGHNDVFHHKIQEIIYYGESRFRHMAAQIFRADAQHRAWMQDALQEEVVSPYIHKTLFTSLPIKTFAKLTVMCYIGMATAMGLNFNIPIVLHSLTMSLFSQNGMKLPIPFDLGFIAMLEVGTNDNQMDKVVHSYAHDWWNDHTRTKVPPYSAMFTMGTIDVCLAHY